jgi:eukaryotic-like serine/threonine-protein kinase
VQTASLPLISGRYQVKAQLGTGGLGIVYRATDMMTGVDVALKLLKAQPVKANPTQSVDLKLLLAREFHLLSSLRHPNIISVMDYGFDDRQQPYYTMELIENGQTILKAGRSATPQEKIDLLVQLLLALVYLHRRGVLHRDLKPSNILVTSPRDPDGNGNLPNQVKLLDFGLAQMRDQAHAASDVPAGTLFYMAPEILNQQPYTEPADLYSVGLIAYELFAGSYPFKLDNIAKLIDNIRNMPPDMSPLDANVELKAVIERLLAKDPTVRYHDPQEAISALCHAVGSQPPRESKAVRESFLQAAEMIGREAEMAQLLQALEGTLVGEGAVWLIAGESGVGKSRVMEEVRTSALVRGALVVRGQTVREGGEPYQLWRHVLRRLAMSVEVTNEEASVLKPFIPDIETLIDGDVLDTFVDADIAAARLHSVIEALIRRQMVIRPVMLLLEDIQWITEEDLSILRHLVELASSLPLLIIASYSVDQNPNIPVLLPPANRLLLERFSEEAIARLSEAMLGHVGLQPHVIEFLKRETEGNAFFIVETVRALAEAAGRLDLIENITIPSLILTRGIQAILEQRVKRVPDECYDLLRVAAVAGRELNLALLRAASPDTNLDEWLQLCGDAPVMHYSDGTWQFSHEKVRDFILSAIPESERSDLHRQVALAMEIITADIDECAAFLAYHWSQAGERAKAEAYARRKGGEN